MKRPIRSNYKYWTGTNRFNEIQYANDLEKYISELETRLSKDDKLLTEKYEPYFGWCDVSGCKNEGASGGCYWKETGYWKICSTHGQMAMEGKPQPEMKLRAVKRENSRNKVTGYLPLKRRWKF